MQAYPQPERWFAHKMRAPTAIVPQAEQLRSLTELQKGLHPLLISNIPDKFK